VRILREERKGNPSEFGPSMITIEKSGSGELHVFYLLPLGGRARKKSLPAVSSLPLEKDPWEERPSISFGTVPKVEKETLKYWKSLT